MKKIFGLILLLALFSSCSSIVYNQDGSWEDRYTKEIFQPVVENDKDVVKVTDTKENKVYYLAKLENNNANVNFGGGSDERGGLVLSLTYNQEKKTILKVEEWSIEVRVRTQVSSLTISDFEFQAADKIIKINKDDLIKGYVLEKDNIEKFQEIIQHPSFRVNVYSNMDRMNYEIREKAKIPFIKMFNLIKENRLTF